MVTKSKQRSEDYYGYFRKRAKRRLDELGWTQTQLAGKLDVPKQYVSNLLTGIRNPGLVTLVDIARALRVEPEYLIKPTRRKRKLA